ncbi:MAG: sulfotransferase [Proteobacteria bacterium]|nr:sulfotransferase [Pseudomonadota bacterium]
MQTQTAAAGSDPIKDLYDRALKKFKAGHAREADMICRRAMPVYRKDPNIMCLLGEISLQLRRPQEAQTWYGKVLKNFNDFPRALEGMGLALLADSRPKQAVDFLHKAVDAAPKRSMTRTALSRALAETGHAAESERALRKALTLDPRKAALAEAEQAQLKGRLEEAEKILRDSLARDPDNPQALRMLANLALDANRFKAAHRMLQRAVELNPAFALAWNDLANLYMKQDRYEKALETVQRAIDVDAKMAHSYVMRGNILTKAQRHEEALLAYQQALDVNPANPGALSGMGHVLKTIGRQDESIEAYRQCIAAHPSFGEAYWSLANLKTFKFDEEEVKVMAAMVEEKTLHDEPKINFYLSLGKHYENEKDYKRAFEQIRLGNELRRGHEIYDPVQTQVIHDRIIKVFQPQFLASHDGWGDPDPSPILVVGLPRSGSTLIEQILASHSMVEGTMELPDLSRSIGELNKSSKGKAEYPETVLNLDQEQIRALGQGYLESTRRYRTDKPHFIDKMPNNFASIGFLHLILPNAKVINARRHPLDSCLGCYKQLFFKGQSWTYDLFEIGQYYLQYQRIMDHWHEVLPGKVLDVHYEQLVLDQETQTRRMLEYLGLPWEDQCLRFYETERAVNTASSEQVRQPIYTDALNFWRHYESQLGELIEILEPLLRQADNQK